jgi:hypothetical protein
MDFLRGGIVLDVKTKLGVVPGANLKLPENEAAASSPHSGPSALVDS